MEMESFPGLMAQHTLENGIMEKNMVMGFLWMKGVFRKEESGKMGRELS